MIPRFLLAGLLVLTLASSSLLAQSEPTLFVCPPCGCAHDDTTFTEGGGCPSCGMALIPQGDLRKVAILVFEGVELLDFAGPGEVFAAAGGYDTYTVGATKEPILSQGFVTITPEYSIDDAPAPDIVVVPGGGVGSLTGDEAVMAWIASVAIEAEHVTSVCNGAFVLGQLGLLDGIESTTHWGSVEALGRRFPETTALANRRFVDSGRVITSAGVSAGIDMALHIVREQLGEEAATWTARYMEYEWEADRAD